MRSVASESLVLGNTALALSATSPSASSYTLISYPSGTISGTSASVSGLLAGFAVTYRQETDVLPLLIHQRCRKM